MKNICENQMPILTVHTVSDLDFSSSSSKKSDDTTIENKNNNEGENLNVEFECSLGRKRNSAFSMYQPKSRFSDVEQEEEQVNSFDDGQFHDKPRRVWKREQRSRRQLKRLETKNLNRYFRSKINYMLREVKQESNNKNDVIKAEKILQDLNKSNQIMFSELRQFLEDKWLQEKLQCCSAGLLRYVHSGKMGMQSKLIMLRYYNKMMKAIRNPQKFTCWK